MSRAQNIIYVMSIILACVMLLVLTAPPAQAQDGQYAVPPAPNPGYDAASLSTIWYLAEGCTINMETWVLVQNPDAAATTVSLALFTDGGAYYPPELQNVPLAGYTRQTYHINAYVSTFDVSTRVTSGAPIVCERAMYGPGRQWATESVGAVVPAAVWYLAEGCTAGGMETWVLVQNPNPTYTTVSLTIITDTATLNPPELQNVSLGASSRRSFNLGKYVTNFNVSTRVDSTSEVVCERAMYGPGRQWATDSIGARATATDWYLAEGCTAAGMETWILVQNPNDYEAHVNLSFCTDTGPENPAATEFIIPAKSRQSINLGVYLGNNRFNLGTRVHCITGDVICERSMYGPGREWATNSIGGTVTDYDWLLAEGCTRNMETWVLIMNPGTTPSAFSVTFMTDAGDIHPPELQNVTINAGSRVSVNAGLYVTDFNVSTEVTASGYDLVVERSMYGPGREWATNSIGVSRNF
jgi:hypothetical protein